MGRILPQEIVTYLKLGLTPVPLRPRSKTPLVKWRNGWTPTLAHLKRFAASLGLNWGVRCGAELAALDFDSEDCFHTFLDRHPETASWPRVKTGRGYHIWLRPKKPVRSQRLGDVEIKCLGSYIVAPPSIHPSGSPYVFETAPNGALPEVDLEALLGAALSTQPDKKPAKGHPLSKCHQQKVESLLLEYLPGARHMGKELVGYLDPDSQSKAHLKVNLDKGVYMDWRKDQGGTVVELLRRLGAPIPPELGGMGEDDIPEYFPICPWAGVPAPVGLWGTGGGCPARRGSHLGWKGLLPAVVLSRVCDSHEEHPEEEAEEGESDCHIQGAEQVGDP